MKNLYFVFLIVTAAITVSCSEDIPEDKSLGSIVGSVSDRTTGEPVATATVSISPGGNSTVTGSDGSFYYTELTPGEYVVSIKKEGYNQATTTVSVKGGGPTDVHTTIERMPASLKTDKTELDFGESVSQLSFTLVNTGYTELSYKVETGNCDWVSADPKSDALSYGKTATIIVKVDRQKLPKGENETVIVVSSTSGEGNIEIKVKAINNATASVNTLEASDLNNSTATLNGEILNPGTPSYTERGFVYDTQATPTVDACIKKLSSPVNSEKKYSCKINGLTPTQTYYARAYIVQEENIIYGNIISFTTSEQPVTLSTSAVTNIEATQAVFNGKILNVGKPALTEKGFCYSATNTNPSITDNKKVVSGTSAGDYSLKVTDLSFPEKYYVRAYAIQSGTAVYGNAVSFSTSSTDVRILTAAATEISSTKATLNGSIADAGTPAYTERGFCLSTSASSSPSVNDTKFVVAGNGIGDFSVQLSNLTYNQRYSFRAYALQNGKPVYGETKYFATDYVQASVVTMDATSVAYTSATFNGSITNEGDPVISERGFCYSETYSNAPIRPNISDKRVKVSGVSGTFKASVNDLKEDCSYYVRAYAIQDGEPIYGEVKKFTTGYTPIVVTGPASNVKSLSSNYWQATFVGRYADGNPEVSDVGFVYATVHDPTVTTGTVIKPTSIKEFSAPDSYEFSRTVNDLSAGKTYYYRAFVKTTFGYIYGDTESFRTL